MALKVHLVCIDIQNDFVLPDPDGALPVGGAVEDSQRTAAMIERLGRKFTDITLTMDSHTKLDISHPLWWVDEHGNPPGIFTGVVPDGDQMWFFDYLKQSKTTRAYTRIPSCRKRTLAYLQALSATGRYPHTIWPPHCLIGTPGQNIYGDVMAAVHKWEMGGSGQPPARANYVTKGSNLWTEHFSAVKAEVPDPEDPSTQINRQLVETIENSDLVAWSGQALSHCLANTFRDAVACFQDQQSVRKMVLLEDASSPVGGFEFLSDAFVRDMKALGMQTSTTTDFLA